ILGCAGNANYNVSYSLILTCVSIIFSMYSAHLSFHFIPFFFYQRVRYAAYRPKVSHFGCLPLSLQCARAVQLVISLVFTVYFFPFLPELTNYRIMTGDTAHIPNGVKFLFGGTAGMGATLVVQPLDLVKNRMQLSGTSGKREYRSSFHALTSIIKNEGVRTVYTGLSAGLLRQASYTTVRLGIYTWLFEKFSSEHHSPSFVKKASIAMTAGAVGAFAGTPAEIVLIRMTGDGRLPPEQRRNYKNAFEAIGRIAREEGITTLWRGCVPTVMRAMVVNAAQLATYSQAKESLSSSGLLPQGIAVHFAASMISGFNTAFVSMPVDIAKTRIQSMRIIDGKPEYKNAGDVILKVIKNEGIFALWKGFTPCYMRIGPHTVLTFIILEQMNGAYYKFVLGVEPKSGL
ncbi:hypothetical protein PMAYCL1PPCAC_06897, partial [Pristionchus mayeri]